MLFGDMAFQKNLFKLIRKIEKEKDITVLYIGVVGSISRGISNYDSDYDVKCLYIKNNTFIEKPYRHNENCIRFRVYDNQKPYECIAFWEISAFVNFLAEPYIDSGYKYDLLKNVAWLFLTPYSWDPLGIKENIHFAFMQCMNVENELIYHYKILQRIIKQDEKGEKISGRDFLRLLHAYLSIEWILEKKEYPPINILSLLFCISNEDIKYYCINILETNKIEKSTMFYELWDKIMSAGLEVNRILDLKEYDFSVVHKNRKVVDHILNIINYLIHRTPYIKNVGIKTYKDVCLEKMICK